MDGRDSHYISAVHTDTTMKFVHPFTALIAGPSGVGNSSFSLQLINNLDNMVDTEIHRIIWCFSEENSLRAHSAIDEKQRRKIIYSKGMPTDFNNDDDVATLIVLDDLMNETDNVLVSTLYSRGSHHNNQSVLLITQNVYHKGSYMRDISLNTKYMVLFKNVRDQCQVRYLLRQISPDGAKELLRVYKDATAIPFNYLLIDLTTDTHDGLRYRTSIFNPEYCTVYCNEKHLRHEDVDGLPVFTLRTT